MHTNIAPKMNVTVNYTDKDTLTIYSHLIEIDKCNVEARSEKLGTYYFAGTPGESVVISSVGTTGNTRVGDLLLFEDIDEDAVKQPIKESMFASDGAPVDKVIEYTTNSKGFVKEIEVLDRTSKSSKPRFKNRDGKYTFTTDSVHEPSDYTIDASTVIFAFSHVDEIMKEPDRSDPKYNNSKNTPQQNQDAFDKDYQAYQDDILRYESQKYLLDQNYYSIIPVSSLKHDMYYYKVEAYDESDDRYAPVVLIRAYYRVTDSFAGQEPYEVMAVSGKSSVLDENGETCVALKGYVGTNEKTVLASEDKVFAGIGIGDIYILLPDKDGKIYHTSKLYDFVEGSPKTDVSRYNHKNNMGSQFSCYYGKVVDIANSGTTLFISNNPADDTKANAYMANMATPAVYICNEKEQTLTPASVGDISIEDMISIYYNSYSAKMVVIYRED